MVGGNARLNLPGKMLIRNFIFFAAALWLAIPFLPAAATKVARHHSPAAKRRKHRTPARRSVHYSAKARTATKASHLVHARPSHRTYAKSRKAHNYRRKKSTKYKVRFASIHMQPERAEQIQQALIHAGDLHESPTGRWDGQTREAMKQYQQQHGFPATGLPDAKSLMKLGLGPHPLPLDADPVAQAKSFPPTTPGEKSTDSGSRQDQPEN